MEKQYFYQNVQCLIVKPQDFQKMYKASGLLSNIRIGIPLSKIPLLGVILFCFRSVKHFN